MDDLCKDSRFSMVCISTVLVGKRLQAGLVEDESTSTRQVYVFLILFIYLYVTLQVKMSVQSYAGKVSKLLTMAALVTIT